MWRCQLQLPWQWLVPDCNPCSVKYVVICYEFGLSISSIRLNRSYKVHRRSTTNHYRHEVCAQPAGAHIARAVTPCLTYSSQSAVLDISCSSGPTLDVGGLSRNIVQSRNDSSVSGIGTIREVFFFNANIVGATTWTNIKSMKQMMIANCQTSMRVGVI